jgi:FKBP-type peptidyl-prolyl cis-trans isomerase
MKKSLVLSVLIALLLACSSETKNDEKVELSSFKDKISYTLGADHARAIANSGDKNFKKYKFDILLEGFKEGLKNEKAFDKSCKETIKNLFGENGTTFNEQYNEEGSECIGKLSAAFFIAGWKQKQALSQIDLEKVIIGFKHGLQKNDTLIPRTEQASMIQNFIADLNKINGNKMLEKARSIKNVTITPSGLVLEKIIEGTGGNPSPSDDVLAHYILMNAIGDTLQDSYKMCKQYNQALTPFSLLAVVPGWQEGIPLMKAGGKYRLYLPYNLAYGEQGMFNPQTQSYDIQPFESLVFFIELLKYGKPGCLSSLKK